MEPTFSLSTLSNQLSASQEIVSDQTQNVMTALSQHVHRFAEEQSAFGRIFTKILADLCLSGETARNEHSLFDQAREYSKDFIRRLILTTDIMRQRADSDAVHEQADCPPVLTYDSEVVVDGRMLQHPVNYLLLKITPPEGVEIKEWKRPYMIIDPRAGHGAGIGGFKSDSQVGVALNDGHPVYFVVFRPHPERGQTLADVMRAEAAFVKEISRLHPNAPKPIIVGNCQGGWATMVMAAANPDITGPLVINGAPLSYWSGRIGENTMRYNGGLLGGLASVLLLSDLGNGQFDGANLVSNFEMLNPSRNYFGKYYDLFDDPENGKVRFLEFERWWGGYHFMNEAEIRWIVEQLFVGNKLARGEAYIERGRRLDIKAIRSPIIVFASWGDNITPPQQALNWIPDTYADEQEIKICGQRIVYMVHDKVGHLGIFVSSTIAKKEHAEVTSTMKTIEALAPGLYEMQIENEYGEGVDKKFSVSFTERRMSDILDLHDNNRNDEHQFAAVARISELNADLYDLFMRPLIQSVVTPEIAQLSRSMHPARMQRGVYSSHNPAMMWLPMVVEMLTEDREKITDDNIFKVVERLWAENINHSLDVWRDIRDACYETSFLCLYGSPYMRWVGRFNDFGRTHKDAEELRNLPQVRAALLNMDRGGLAEAVIRMLLLLSEARGSVRRDRLERSAKMLTVDEPFRSLGAQRRGEIINEQSIIIEFEPEKAVQTLPALVPTAAEKKKAILAVEFVAGAIDEMEPHTFRMLQKIRGALDLEPIVTNLAFSDPLLLENDARQSVELN